MLNHYRSSSVKPGPHPIRACLVLLPLLCAAALPAGLDDYAPGLETMAKPELLAFLHRPGTVTKQFISADVSGGNTDGSFKNAYTKYVDSNGRAVIFDEYGPGCLYRQQMNIWSLWDNGVKPVPDAGKARIKYYFDNEPQPRIDMTMDDFFGGDATPFDKPFVFRDPKNMFAILYYPFAFQKRLKITVEPSFDWSDRWTTWYQYTYLAYPADAEVQTWSGKYEKHPAINRQWENLGQDPKDAAGNKNAGTTVSIPSGQTKTILNLTGAGSVSSLKMNVSPFTKETFFNTNVKIYWDGAETPAVDLPLGYLFGGGGKDYPCSDDVWQKTLRTLLFGFNKNAGTFYCYWPMPYWSSVRIDVHNAGGSDITSLKCDATYRPSETYAYPRGRAGYFCAKRTTDRDTGGEAFARTFEEHGRGHVVGISFFTDKYDMDGDEFTYIDGSRTPQIHGDGTEDDHNQGWGGSAYQKPLWGGLINGFQGAYRIYMNDSYIFNSDIRINYEYSRCAGLPRGGDTDVTIFYYKAADNKMLKLTDELDVANEASEKAHSYLIEKQKWQGTISSAYDGYERNTEYDKETDNGRAFDGFSRFTVKLDPENQAVRLRRRIYRSGNGVQTARLLIDGEEVAGRLWHIVTPSAAPANQGWYESDFEIPARYTAGKRKVTIQVEYVDSPSKKQLNEFYYWVYCYPK